MVNCFSLSPRTQHWRQLRESLRRLRWSRVDTKDGITVGRCKFGSSSNGQAIIKVEGVLPADPNTVYQFLKISTKDGGKVRSYMYTYIHIQIERDRLCTALLVHLVTFGPLCVMLCYNEELI